MDWERATAELKKDLDGGIIKTRKGGGGKELSYIDHFTAIDTANRIFGHGGWSRHTVMLKQISDRPVAYMAKVRITVGEVVRDGYGYGADPTGKGDHEKAFKEAETDATKRALMTFGYPLGLALYQKEGEREHVSNGDQRVEPVRSDSGNGGISPHEFPRESGDPSAAQSKKLWAVLHPAMMKCKTPPELNKWWVGNVREVAQMSSEFRWRFFGEVIQRGTDLCQSKMAVDLFWSFHENKLKELRKINPVNADSLEEYMTTKAKKLAERELEAVNAG